MGGPRGDLPYGPLPSVSQAGSHNLSWDPSFHDPSSLARPLPTVFLSFRTTHLQNPTNHSEALYLSGLPVPILVSFLLGVNFTQGALYHQGA